MYFSFQNMFNSSIIGALQYRVGNKITLKVSNNHDSELKSGILKPSNRGGQKPSLRAQCHKIIFLRNQNERSFLGLKYI